MEVTLDKKYPIDVTVEQAWAVLSDIRATAACMPGAQITEQLDDTHYKGTVKSKIGPAVMSFGGDIEVVGIDPAARRLQMIGKGTDKGGSSAAMDLTAHLEPDAATGHCVLVGQAVVTVSGKLAQYGSRLLVPVSDAMLQQFAGNFRNAAAAVPVAAPAAAAPEAAADAAPAAVPDSGQAVADILADTPASPAIAHAPAPAPAPVAAVPPKPTELNALSLMWTVIKGWFAGLFGKRA